MGKVIIEQPPPQENTKGMKTDPYGNVLSEEDLEPEAIKAETPMQIFDDWFWYEEQAAFEHQTNQFIGGFNREKKCALIIRGILAFFVFVDLSFLVIMSPNRLKELRLFNFWGLLFTLSALVAGTCVYQKQTYPTEQEAIENDPEYPKKKFRCCRAWKIYSFLYPVTLITEFVLTVYYWAFLWPGYCEIDGVHYASGDWPARCYSIVFDHSIPLLALVVDLFLNMQPFIRRHVTLMTFLAFVYIVFNFLWTIITKKPIYPTMDWKSLKGIATPIILLFMVPIIYFLFEKLNNRIKMTMCRQKPIVEIAEGKAWILKQQEEQQKQELEAQGRLDLIAKFNQSA